MPDRETKAKKCRQRSTAAYPHGGICNCSLRSAPISTTRPAPVGDSCDPSARRYTAPSPGLTDADAETITPRRPDRAGGRANQLRTKSSSAHEDDTSDSEPDELEEGHSALTRDAANSARFRTAKSCRSRQHDVGGGLTVKRLDEGRSCGEGEGVGSADSPETSLVVAEGTLQPTMDC